MRANRLSKKLRSIQRQAGQRRLRTIYDAVGTSGGQDPAELPCPLCRAFRRLVIAEQAFMAGTIPKAADVDNGPVERELQEARAEWERLRKEAGL